MIKEEDKGRRKKKMLNGKDNKIKENIGGRSNTWNGRQQQQKRNDERKGRRRRRK